jgi:hypothetical protein
LLDTTHLDIDAFWAAIDIVEAVEQAESGADCAFVVGNQPAVASWWCAWTWIIADRLVAALGCRCAGGRLRVDVASFYGVRCGRAGTADEPPWRVHGYRRQCCYIIA